MISIIKYSQHIENKQFFLLFKFFDDKCNKLFDSLKIVCWNKLKLFKSVIIIDLNEPIRRIGRNHTAHIRRHKPSARKIKLVIIGRESFAYWKRAWRREGSVAKKVRYTHWLDKVHKTGILHAIFSGELKRSSIKNHIFSNFPAFWFFHHGNYGKSRFLWPFLDIDHSHYAFGIRWQSL